MTWYLYHLRISFEIHFTSYSGVFDWLQKYLGMPYTLAQELNRSYMDKAQYLQDLRLHSYIGPVSINSILTRTLNLITIMLSHVQLL